MKGQGKRRDCCCECPDHRDRNPYGIFAEHGHRRNTQGLEDVTDYPDITKALEERGLSDEDIQKILGENYLRVLKEVTGE